MYVCMYVCMYTVDRMYVVDDCEYVGVSIYACYACMYACTQWIVIVNSWG